MTYLTVSDDSVTTSLNQVTSFFNKLNLWVVAKAVVILVIGYIILKILLKILSKALEKSKLDATYYTFINSTVKILGTIILFIIVGASLNADMTVLIALLSAAGLAVSLALKDSISNIASGLLILSSKPFIKGDYIETSGVSGSVDEISLFYTHITTPDNKVIYIPNGQISGSTLINYSAQTTRRVDLTFSTSYQDDMAKTKKLLNELVARHDKIKEEPIPIIRMAEHGDSAIKYAVKVWVNKEDYWDVYFDLIEEVKEQFDKNNISIPFNQLNIEIKNNNK